MPNASKLDCLKDLLFGFPGFVLYMIIVIVSDKLLSNVFLGTLWIGLEETSNFMCMCGYVEISVLFSLSVRWKVPFSPERATYIMYKTMCMNVKHTRAHKLHRHR